LLLERLEDRTVPSATWVEQGPGPIVGTGTGDELPAQNNPTTGAVNAIAVNPANPDIAYAASVNGGVWRTDNLTAPNPTWRPLTDQQLPFLDIASVALSPVNPDEVFAGSGARSSLDGYGGSAFGVTRSLDGGQHWQVLASDFFGDQKILKIVPTTLNGGQVVFATSLTAGHSLGRPNLRPGGGLYRSADGGVTWAQVSGAPGTGLPAEGVSDLVADPGNPNRFYAGVAPGLFGATGQEGVYRSDDGGLTWTQVNNGLKGLNKSARILLSVHDSAAGNAVYAMVLTGSGLTDVTLGGVFRSADQGAEWSSMGTPAINIFQNGNGSVQGAITADPNNPNVVYIGGDSDNTISSLLSAATVMRGDASQSNKNVWTKLYHDGANDTTPHCDSRALAFDPSGNLLFASDGGAYRLNNPNDSSRQWSFISNGLADVEFIDVAYDPISKVILGGTQDNGTPIQVSPGAMAWDTSHTVPNDDGGFVAVDADQAAHPGTSIRYNSGIYLNGFNRSTWDTNNNFLGSSLVGLNIVAGPGAGKILLKFDRYVQFYDPITLNAVDSNRLLIGTKSLYESFDQGDTLTNLNFSNGSYVGATSTSDGSLNDSYGQPMVYGGRLAGLANPDVIWAGVGNQVAYREHQGDPLQVVSGYRGDYVETIVADPQNYRHVFVVDVSSQVWASPDAGQSFQNITANLTQLTPLATTIELVSTGPDPQNEVLVAGTLNGVFAMNLNSSGGNPWHRLGDNLPHAVVLDLHYTASDHLLLAGTLGRGAWTLKNPFGDTDTSDVVGGSASPAGSTLAASLATFSRSPGALDAFFAALAGEPPPPPAPMTGSQRHDGFFAAISGGRAAGHKVEAPGGLRVADAAVAPPSPGPTVFPATAVVTPAAAAAPPAPPGATHQGGPAPAGVSGTATPAPARRHAHRPAYDWATDVRMSADPS
jgi:hypothetical protein